MSKLNSSIYGHFTLIKIKQIVTKIKVTVTRAKFSFKRLDWIKK